MDHVPARQVALVAGLAPSRVAGVVEATRCSSGLLLRPVAAATILSHRLRQHQDVRVHPENKRHLPLK